MATNYSDKDISTNLLISLKHMKAEFNTFTQEASNDALYKETHLEVGYGIKRKGSCIYSKL